jgi:hypothetical protein
MKVEEGNTKVIGIGMKGFIGSSLEPFQALEGFLNIGNPRQ